MEMFTIECVSVSACMCVCMCAHACTCMYLHPDACGDQRCSFSLFLLFFFFETKITCWTWSSLSLQCSSANELQKSVYIFSKLELQIYGMSVCGFNPISSCLLASFHWLTHEYILNNEVLEKSFKWTIGAVPNSFPEHFQAEKTVTGKISKSSVKVKN